MKSITPTQEMSGPFDHRYLFNSSNNKNYMDIDNVFMDGGTGAIHNIK
jgi:hypothetical protein